MVQLIGFDTDPALRAGARLNQRWCSPAHPAARGFGSASVRDTKQREVHGVGAVALRPELDVVAAGAVRDAGQRVRSAGLPRRMFFLKFR